MEEIVFVRKESRVNKGPAVSCSQSQAASERKGSRRFVIGDQCNEIFIMKPVRFFIEIFDSIDFSSGQRWLGE